MSRTGTFGMSALLKATVAAVKLVAAEEVMPRYLKVAHQRKSDGSLCTEADIATQAALVRKLQSFCKWGIHLFTVILSAKDALAQKYPAMTALY